MAKKDDVLLHLDPVKKKTKCKFTQLNRYNVVCRDNNFMNICCIINDYPYKLVFVFVGITPFPRIKSTKILSLQPPRTGSVGGARCQAQGNVYRKIFLPSLN